MPDAYDKLVRSLNDYIHLKGEPTVIKLGVNTIKRLKNAVNISPEGGMWFKGIAVELHDKPNGVSFEK